MNVHAPPTAGEPTPAEKQGRIGREIGVTGLKATSGYIFEEFLRDLAGDAGRKKFAEMANNDATVGAVLAAIGLVLSAVEWTTEPANDSAEAEAEAEFVDSIFQDMSHSWEDLLAEILSMLVFGWSYLEIVLKRRVGPTETDPSKRSKFTDGRIGIRKLPIRSQDSLWKWELQDDGGVSGMWQLRPYQGGGPLFVPIEDALLFRTTSRKNNPEGVSVIRTAYESWYFLKNIRFIEAVGIERELAGVPVVYCPGRLLSSTRSEDDASLYNALVQIARDLKHNEQGGVVIAGDPYMDKDGNPTNIRQIQIEILKGGGTRAIDTVAVKNDYKRDIARSVLADFVMLGQDKGAYNLGESKVDLFLHSCEATLKQIAAPINMYLLPRLWAYNGLDPALMPTRKPGRVAPADLAKLGTFLRDLSTSGATIFPDENLENYLRNEADLPEKSPEAVELDEASREASLAAANALAENGGVPPTNEPPPGEA